TSLKMSPFSFLVLLFVVVGLARSAALRSPQGGAEGQVNGGRAATAASFEARFCISRRTACRHGCSAGGTHFGWALGGLGRVDRSAACWKIGLAGAGISCQRSARPRYSISIPPCRPSHTSTWPRAGA